MKSLSYVMWDFELAFREHWKIDSPKVSQALRAVCKVKNHIWRTEGFEEMKRQTDKVQMDITLWQIQQIPDKPQAKPRRKQRKKQRRKERKDYCRQFYRT